jgi:hypothetical protein
VSSDTRVGLHGYGLGLVGVRVLLGYGFSNPYPNPGKTRQFTPGFSLPVVFPSGNPGLQPNWVASYKVGGCLGSIPPPRTDIGRAGPCNPYQDSWEHLTVIEHMRVSNSDYRAKKEISYACHDTVCPRPPPLSPEIVVRVCIFI